MTSLTCEIFSDAALALPDWRRLEAGGVLTPYQRAAWIMPWLHHAGSEAGVAPAITVLRDAQGGEPVALFPFCVSRRGPGKVIRFAGGRHANFNMGVFAPGAAPRIDRPALDAMFAAIRKATQADAAILESQPREWQGFANPLTALPGSESPEPAYKFALAGSFEELIGGKLSKDARQKLRRKERRLAELGPVSFSRAQTPEEVRETLAAFLAQKQARFAQLGQPDVFAEPGLQAFIAAGSLDGLAEGRPAIELYRLKAGERIVACYGAALGPDRFCGMFTSFDASEDVFRWSPGELILLYLVEAMLARGLATFDLGVGEAKYKESYCDQTEALFDSAIPLSLTGRAVALAYGAAISAKQQIKESPRALALVNRLRRAVGS